MVKCDETSKLHDKWGGTWVLKKSLHLWLFTFLSFLCAKHNYQLLLSSASLKTLFCSIGNLIRSSVQLASVLPQAPAAHLGCRWWCRWGCCPVPSTDQGSLLGRFTSPFAFAVGKSLCAFSRNLRAFSVWQHDNAAVAMSMQRSASSLFTSIAAGQKLTGPEVNKCAGWWRHTTGADGVVFQ